MKNYLAIMIPIPANPNQATTIPDPCIWIKKRDLFRNCEFD